MGKEILRSLRRSYWAVLALVVIPAQIAMAIAIDQIDTFEDETTMGWFVPGSAFMPPATEPNGGPAGAGDAYLKLVATGAGGAGSRLSVLNEAQWTGDYLSSGVNLIRMDVNNFWLSRYSGGFSR
jgi:hypothetical protein